MDDLECDSCACTLRTYRVRGPYPHRRIGSTPVYIQDLGISVSSASVPSSSLSHRQRPGSAEVREEPEFCLGTVTT